MHAECDQRLPAVLILREIHQSLHIGRGIPAVDDDGRVAADLTQTARSRRDDRQAGREGLEYGEPESFIERRKEQHIRGAVGATQ